MLYRGTGRWSPGRPPPELINLGIHHQPKPIRLQKVKNEPFLAIQPSGTNEVSIEKIQEWTNQERQPAPLALKE
jgi:hypothetical protein